MKLLSWNVNGIRACSRQGFVDKIKGLKADLIGLQEVRAGNDQIPPEIEGWLDYPYQYYVEAEKKGYSGVGILSRVEPDDVIIGLKTKHFDIEGRVIAAVLPKLIYVSAYFPNSQDGGKRIAFKIEFCHAIHVWLKELQKKHPSKIIVLTGDFNIAHEEIDLARPDDNHESAGFLPQERKWMSEFLESGWIDTFRYLHPKKVQYSWWSARTRARERNVGWRIDYHAVPTDKAKYIKSAAIHDDIVGSDHCPVSLVLDI